MDELHELCTALKADPRPMVLTGAEGFFAAGADIRQLREHGPRDALPASTGVSSAG